MSIFNFFGNDSNKDTASSAIMWNALIAIQQLNVIVEESQDSPVLIFKHSTRCSISRFALKQFEKEFDLEGKIKPYFLDLLEHRAISNEIASQFNVQHQSPQILLIKNGISVYDSSHDNIQVNSLRRFL